MRHILPFIVLLLLPLGGCTLPDAYAKANQQANQIWVGLTMYQSEIWAERRDLRRKCKEIIDPAIDRLVAENRMVDAIQVIRENYPGLVIPQALEDLREDLAAVLAEMPSCTWPEDIVLAPMS